MKTNLQILENTLGWPDGSLTGHEKDPISVPIDTVLLAMNNVQKEWREKIQKLSNYYTYINEGDDVCKSEYNYNLEIIKELENLLNDTPTTH
jgi:hypothetical protein